MEAIQQIVGNGRKYFSYQETFDIICNLVQMGGGNVNRDKKMIDWVYPNFLSADFPEWLNHHKQDNGEVSIHFDDFWDMYLVDDVEEARIPKYSKHYRTNQIVNASIPEKIEEGNEEAAKERAQQSWASQPHDAQQQEQSHPNPNVEVPSAGTSLFKSIEINKQQDYIQESSQIAAKKEDVNEDSLNDQE